jgi:hypothetical protein
MRGVRDANENENVVTEDDIEAEMASVTRERSLWVRGPYGRTCHGAEVREEQKGSPYG